MRGIIWEDVQRVELVQATHPKIQSFLRWRDRHIAAQLETKFHERAQERQHLSALFGVPIDRLLTLDGLITHYQQYRHRVRTQPVRSNPTCRECRHCADDRYTPGALVCWQAWTGGRPKPLTTVTPCAAFQDRRQETGAASWYGLRSELTAFLASYGIHYSPGRWQAHVNDLARAAGTWGFAVGTQWEQDVRAWLTACYGERFFVPHRWLLITDRSGATHYREVDGIERVDSTQAFVYEIKHRTPGYTQLAEEYVPLLQRAYPERLFTPIEINAENPYRGYIDLVAPPVRLLRSLDERTMDGQYQLLVVETIPQYACAAIRSCN